MSERPPAIFSATAPVSPVRLRARRGGGGVMAGRRGQTRSRAFGDGGGRCLSAVASRRAALRAERAAPPSPAGPAPPLPKRGSHPDDLRHGVHEDLAVADLPGQRGDGDGAHDEVDLVPGGMRDGGAAGRGGVGKGQSVVRETEGRIEAARGVEASLPPPRPQSLSRAPRHHYVERRLGHEVGQAVLGAAVALAAPWGVG
jgi:hypothetical protein